MLELRAELIEPGEESHSSKGWLSMVGVKSSFTSVCALIAKIRAYECVYAADTSTRSN